jgi:hypothetical protein
MTCLMICPRCNKSREFYEVRERDPKTKKYWVITRCQKCAYNADIKEGTSVTRVAKVIYPPTERDNRDPDGGWAI